MKDISFHQIEASFLGTLLYLYTKEEGSADNKSKLPNGAYKKKQNKQTKDKQVVSNLVGGSSG